MSKFRQVVDRLLGKFHSFLQSLFAEEQKIDYATRYIQHLEDEIITLKQDKERMAEMFDEVRHRPSETPMTLPQSISGYQTLTERRAKLEKRDRDLARAAREQELDSELAVLEEGEEQ